MIIPVWYYLLRHSSTSSTKPLIPLFKQLYWFRTFFSLYFTLCTKKLIRCKQHKILISICSVLQTKIDTNEINDFSTFRNLLSDAHWRHLVDQMKVCFRQYFNYTHSMDRLWSFYLDSQEGAKFCCGNILFNWPWWWFSGQHARLLLWWSEFESHWCLQYEQNDPLLMRTVFL